jgi:penicillin-binding protein 1A
MEQGTGYVRAISGGRGEKTHSLSLNRATDTLRQPGSTFKVLADFAPALDIAGATLATTQYDAPYAVNGKEINNWWASSRVWPDGYVGYANIRQGIVYSMNIIAVKTFMNVVSPQLGYQYLLNFGFTSLVESRIDAQGNSYSDITPTLCLGGLTDGVSNLELTAAYAAIANKGIYTEPIFYTRVLDRNGKIILNNTAQSHTVLKESTAFLLTDAMSESIGESTLYNTAIESGSYMCVIPGMSVAGKTGTTTNNNDSWFVGFTPYYTAGIWMGFDNNGELEGGAVVRIIWQKIMERVHEGLPDIGFGDPPEGVTKVTICAKSGKLAIEGVCDNDPRAVDNPDISMTYDEYFAQGTAPTEYCDCHVALTLCNETGTELLAAETCPEEHRVTRVYMVLRSSDTASETTVPSEDTETNPDGQQAPDNSAEETLPPSSLENVTSPWAIGTPSEATARTADEMYTIPDDLIDNYCWVIR